MPELNLGPPPSRSALPAVLLAVIVLGLGAAAVFYFNPHTTAVTTVTRVQTYAAHTETKEVAGGTRVIGEAQHGDDDLYVAVQVTLEDKLRLPLFIKDETLTLTLQDGSVMEASAFQSAELGNIYAAFPAVQAMASVPLARDTQVAASGSASGMMLFHFGGAPAKLWDERKSARLTIDLFHQSPQIVDLPK